MEYGILNEDYTVTPTDDYKAAWGASEDRKRIKQEPVADYYVSTVFLPMNHRIENGPDRWFETYVFTKKAWEGNDSLIEVWGKRCGTYKQALGQHELAKQWVLDGAKEEAA